MSVTAQDVLDCMEENLGKYDQAFAEQKRKEQAGLSPAELAKHSLREGGTMDTWGKKCGVSAKEFQDAYNKFSRSDEACMEVGKKLMAKFMEFANEEEIERMKQWQAAAQAGSKK